MNNVKTNDQKWDKETQKLSRPDRQRIARIIFMPAKKIASWIRIHNLETWFFFHPKKFPGYVCLVSVWSYQADWEFVNVNFCTSDWNRTGMEKLFMEKVGIFLLSLSLSLSLFPSLSILLSLSLSLTLFLFHWLSSNTFEKTIFLATASEFFFE